MLLKTILMLVIRKLDLIFLAWNLDKFSIFDGFLDLANFWDLENY